MDGAGQLLDCVRAEGPATVGDHFGVASHRYRRDAFRMAAGKAKNSHRYEEP